MDSPVKLIEQPRFGDDRGWFAEVYSVERFRGLGIDCTFVQDNHSRSTAINTVRGLHFQLPPHGQDKLVRCTMGRIFDVAVDVRNGSPTFGDWVGAELSAESGEQLFIPIGFAHGFITLDGNCEVQYKCSSGYAPEYDAGIRWAAPEIGVPWPVTEGVSLQVSEKDKKQPLLREFNSPFEYDGRPLLPLK